MCSMVNNNRIFINSKDKKKVEKYVNQFLNDYVKRNLFETKNKSKLRKYKNNCINKINALFECKKNSEKCFNKGLYKLCWKYFSNNKKIIYNSKEICKIRKQIENC